MDRVLEALTPAQESLFLTLYLRALDARSTSPTLDDTVSSVSPTGSSTTSLARSASASGEPCSDALVRKRRAGAGKITCQAPRQLDSHNCSA